MFNVSTNCYGVSFKDFIDFYVKFQLFFMTLDGTQVLKLKVHPPMTKDKFHLRNISHVNENCC